MLKETIKRGNSFSSFKTTLLNGKMRKGEFKQQKNNLNKQIKENNNKMFFSFDFLKTKFILNFCLIIAIIILIGNDNNVCATEIKTSFPSYNHYNLFGDEFNGIQQFQRTYSNNLEFFKRNSNNNNPSSFLLSKPQKRRMVVRVPFASQNPDGSQLSRIYKQLFEPTATRTKKQPFSPFYQRYIIEAETKDGKIY
ncbi:hypothetical protein ACQ4LE_007871 [Meloidogyne hapla]|uniref:Uncharacterized protein n=1 Tax=Meloidogyne hapla TaxID=6305 RepID=A0A1I8BEE1_MELHA